MAKVSPVEPINNFNINRISNGTSIIGSIEAAGDLRIDGRVEGTVTTTGKVVVGESGHIKGDLIVKNLDMMGHLEGTIVASDTVVLKASAYIEGNLSTDKLIVEAGAVFSGACTMGQKES